MRNYLERFPDCRFLTLFVFMAYETTWYDFSKHPDSDSCWSLSTGPDGRIYAAACCEGISGGVVQVTRYNDETDSIDYLFSVDEVTDDPFDSGRATQCKIHYSFAPSLSDGIMYMATHLSAPPFNEKAYSPWNSWDDPKRCFRGAALIAYDTNKDEVLWWDTLLPKEGCRCLLLDEKNGLLYAIGYPRDHMIQYDLETRKSRDLGRISSINPQAMFSDSRSRIWTTDDYGHLVRYDPASDRIERSPHVLPHNPEYQTGWHSVFYDVVASPEKDCVYAVTWNGGSHLIRIWPEEGEWGLVEDLGPVTPPHDPVIPEQFFIDHSGGLVFGADGMLYYAASRWKGEFPVKDEMFVELKSDVEVEGVVWRMNPATLEREEVAILKRPETAAQYVTRGAVDKNGDLFFGHVGRPTPVGFFKMNMP